MGQGIHCTIQGQAEEGPYENTGSAAAKPAVGLAVALLVTDTSAYQGVTSFTGNTYLPAILK